MAGSKPAALVLAELTILVELEKDGVDGGHLVRDEFVASMMG